MSLISHLINSQILSGASQVPKYINASFPDKVTPMTGKLRWYPPAQATINKVEVFIGTAPPAPIVIDVKKNGVSIFSGAYPTILAGQFVSSVISVNVGVSTTDYLTIDVLSGEGYDMTVRIDYV